MSEKKRTAGDAVRSLPFFVWFCGVFAYLFFIVLTMLPHLKEMDKGVQGITLLVLFVPYLWFIFVRFGGSDESED